MRPVGGRNEAARQRARSVNGAVRAGTARLRHRRHERGSLLVASAVARPVVGRRRHGRNEAHLDEAEELLRAVGKVVRVPEKYHDAVTAISGSGPAYIFYIVEAMIEAGVVLGLPRATASELVIQTVYGAATMLRETGEHPSVLRENVSSPAGTTVAALRELDDHKVRAAFISALEAARNRSQQLASGH